VLVIAAVCLLVTYAHRTIKDFRLIITPPTQPLRGQASLLNRNIVLLSLLLLNLDKIPGLLAHHYFLASRSILTIKINTHQCKVKANHLTFSIHNLILFWFSLKTGSILHQKSIAQLSPHQLHHVCSMCCWLSHLILSISHPCCFSFSFICLMWKSLAFSYFICIVSFIMFIFSLLLLKHLLLLYPSPLCSLICISVVVGLLPYFYSCFPILTCFLFLSVWFCFLQFYSKFIPNLAQCTILLVLLSWVQYHHICWSLLGLGGQLLDKKFLYRMWWRFYK
jgi:hypothetical protein